MKTGIFVTARLGSTRLPRKHLLSTGARPMLGILLERIRRSFQVQLDSGDIVIVITTSDELENRDFEDLRRYGADVFYGSVDNIPLRHRQAADALSVEQIVAVDGDDVLCSVAAMRRVREALSDGSPYAKTSGLPLGMNAFGYSREFLADSLRGNQEQTLETGWGRIFDEARATSIPMSLPGSTPENLRFTLDYPEDCEFFRGLAAAFGERILGASDEEIVACVVERRFHELTDPIIETYWEHFEAVRAREMGGN